MKADGPSRSNIERSESTRGALLAAARTLFVDRGFARTSTPEIVEAAQVTRGALYHHFVDKADVFLAVATEMAREVAHEISKARGGPGLAFDELRAGARRYFSAMAEGGRARLLLIESPAVLTPEQILMLSDASGAVEFRAGLSAALGQRGRAKPALHALANLLSAAFDRAALMIARGEPPADYVKAVDIVIDSLELWGAARSAETDAPRSRKASVRARPTRS